MHTYGTHENSNGPPPCGHGARKETWDECRLEEIVRQTLEGRTQAEIASDLGIHQTTVSRALSESRRRWREKSDGDFADLLADRMMKIDLIERTAWRAYGVSRTGDGPDTPRAGDPKYLALVLKCVDRRLRCMGTVRAAVAVVTDGGPIVGRAVEQIQAEIEEVQAKIAALEREDSEATLLTEPRLEGFEPSPSRD